jgi:hypothetical protein
MAILVLYAHGFRGTGLELTVSDPRLRHYLVESLAHVCAYIMSDIGYGGRVFARRMCSRGSEDAAELPGRTPGHVLRWAPQKITPGHPVEPRGTPGRRAKGMITRRDLLRGVAGTVGLLGWPPGHVSAEPPPHVGCFELFSTDQIHAIRDLRDKTVAITELGLTQHVFLSSIVAHVGLDPRKDVHFIEHPPPRPSGSSRRERSPLGIGTSSANIRSRPSGRCGRS